MADDIKALGCHVFMGGMTRGVAEHLDVQAQMEIFNLGEETVEHNFKIPFWQADSEEDWYPIVMDKYRDVPVVYGNPRCTGFSALGHGCSEDAHGAWANPTVDIRQLCRMQSWIKPLVWGFESVTNAATVGRELIEWIHQEYGAGYRRAELFHNAYQFGNAQYRRRIIFLWYKEGLSLPAEEITEKWLWRGKPPTTEDALRGTGSYKGMRDLWNVEALQVPSLHGFDTIGKLEAASPWVMDRLPPTDDHEEGTPVSVPVLNHHYGKINDSYLEASLKLVKEGGTMNGLPAGLLEEAGYDEFAEKKEMGISFSWHAPRKLHRKRACPVIYSASGKFMHPEHQRPLTVRELARIMGLDDDWAVLGNDPIAQIGKGVCVHVGRWIGDMIKCCITGEVKRKIDPGHPVEQFRFDKEYGWVPKKPRIGKPEYEGYEGED